MAPQMQEHGNIETSVAYFRRLRLDGAMRILDIGTRFGSFIQRLEELGYPDVYGIDIDAVTIARGREAYPRAAARLQIYDGRTIPYPAEHFDLVTMLDVLEHIPDAERFLREEVLRVLKPGGLLMFQTPNKWINIPWEILHNRSLTRWRRHHCSLQGLGSLKRLLKDAGFTGVHIEKHEIRTAHNLAKIRKVLGPVGPPLLEILQRFPLVFYPNLWGWGKKAGESG